VAADIELDALLVLRKQFNAENQDQKVSINDLLVKASAYALMEVPAINSQLINDEIHQYTQPHISIVIAVEGGLSTPVIRCADEKTIQQISAEIKDFAERAASGSLKMNEIMGGSFSISNLGMYGVDHFDAIINPPQVAILAVSGASQKVVIKQGEVSAVAVMRVNLSMDHRAIDGATGARFLSVLREKIEYPQSLLA
jgi:pyruvate dehydrogenase E2 component (dihydrolipoamide acetyltransferase)